MERPLFEARLVARGFTQVHHGLDYDETYAPVTRLETIRLLFAMAVEKDWEIRQIDVKTAYLYGDLDEEIYMEPPPGYEVPEGHVLRLGKALYGLKQAGRQWYRKLKSVMGKFGLKQITNDPHTFIGHKIVSGVRRTTAIPIYVDDLFPIGDKVLTDDFETWIPKYFDVTLTGDASYFLGIRVTRSRDADEPYLCLDQAKFATTVLERFEVTRNTRVATPLPQNEDLVPNTDPKEDADANTVRNYQRVIGSLMYLMLGTRPDLAYSVGKLARFSSNPSPRHVEIIDRVLSYLKTHRTHDIMYVKNGSIEPEGYVDADFAGDTSDRKSTAGYAFMLGGSAFSWSSKRESSVATSTMEAEYIALFLGAQQAAWIWQFYNQIGFPLESPITIYSDSQAAIAVAKAEQTHQRTKYLDVDLHSIRERINEGQIVVHYVPSRDNPADIFTKSLSRDLFHEHAKYLGVEPLVPLVDSPPEVSPSPSQSGDAEET